MFELGEKCAIIFNCDKKQTDKFIQKTDLSENLIYKFLNLKSNLKNKKADSEMNTAYSSSFLLQLNNFSYTSFI